MYTSINGCEKPRSSAATRWLCFGVNTETGTNSVTITGAWMDNSQHGKNANVAISDGSVQAFSIAKLREAFKNTGDANQNRLLFP